ncbi:hypothetical protein [Dyella lutea]|uniref:Uncharacterized protein n=1 Tax=Dyella lutea TaxID=2950441 RepID=A0ABT1FF96_9GAMM|nr:hypothetical protein [Dyella lutea]MCP1376056.1 hypothetical protein [Dyella lutea]
MPIYAIVKNGIVENIIMWDGDANTWSEPEGSSAVEISSDTQACMGATYANGVFTPPPSLGGG